MRKITKKDYIEYFIGREDIYLEGYKKEGSIIDQLDRHLAGNTRIGSYGTYQSKKKRDKEYDRFRRRYVCIDIDRHYKNNNKKTPYSKEELDIELKKIEEKIEIILSRCEEFFMVSRSHIIKESSPHGFHLWIILKKDTLLKDAIIYSEYIKSKIETFLKEDVEVFPKTKLSRTKNPGVGFAVHLPNPNTKVNDVIKIINLSSILKKYKTFLQEQKKTYKKIQKIKIEKKVKKFKQEIRKGKWQSVDFDCESLEIYRNDFNCDKCVRNFLNGQQLNGENGNLMRVQCCMRLNRDGFSKDEINEAYWSQHDFDNDTTSYRVNIIADTYSKYPRCKTVYELGFCDPTCLKFKGFEFTIKKVEKYPQKIVGFDELHEEIKKYVKKKGAFFLEKTTRSGTTTAVVIQSIKQKKNLLMVAPTHRIFDKTVKEAIEIGIQDNHFSVFDMPKTFKILSNNQKCKKNIEHLKNYPILEGFPFLLNSDCNKCSYRYSDCIYYEFTQTINDYGIIYMTTHKFKALIQSAKQSNKTKKLLNDLINWSDIVFIDEFNHLIENNRKSFIIDGENPSNDTYIHFVDDCRQILNKIKKIDKKYSKSDFYRMLNDFVEHLSFHIKSIKEYLPKHVKNLVEDFKTLFPKDREKFLTKNGEWSNSFSHLVNYCKNTNSLEIIKLLNIFFALHTQTLYLQKFSPKEHDERIELCWYDDPVQVFNLINSFSKNKTVFMTDAIKPLFDLKTFFPNIKYVIINDPNFTAEKITVIVHSESDPTYPMKYMYSEQKTNRIKRFLELFKDQKFQVFNRNIKVEIYLANLQKEMGITTNAETNTHFRSVFNYGVKSDLRLQLVIGNTQPPSHVFDFFAKECIKLGYVDKNMDYLELGKYLENFNAMSTFIQAVSRAKDPKGKIESEVHVIGVSKRTIIQWDKALSVNMFKIKDYLEEIFE